MNVFPTFKHFMYIQSVKATEITNLYTFKCFELHMHVINMQRIELEIGSPKQTTIYENCRTTFSLF